ncbi:MAG: leucyl/phenylalanyl-tRNA--protein transferase [Gammaproteobacteria bacterium]|jgi:leucyl/phenylalanyl-tRNA--protein transferase|nr:leucyl/phenylalanyl-tRNA--protein transferase [Chromatiales bacterium]MDP6674966.1 leucyl/phenylalanyl-tRNA--protein transferase [Gammaproteobacteria bacterium]
MNEPDLNLRWIDPDAPPDEFPDPCNALTDPNGLLAIGGDLSIERLLAAYRLGIFPWFSDDQPILWWTPDPRAVLFPAEIRISRSLTKTLRKNIYSVSVDQAFADVVAGCAARGAHRDDNTGTWITARMAAAYEQLHKAGHAHSIETWCDGQLVGGLYGISIGRTFFGESMFSHLTDASKVALIKLRSICRATGIELIDCQVASRHLASLGSREISRTEFNHLLTRLTTFPSPGNWPRDSMETSRLLD